MPAALRIFWRRSSRDSVAVLAAGRLRGWLLRRGLARGGLALGRSGGRVQDVLGRPELAQRRQRVQVGKAEDLEELARGRVEERAARRLLAADDLHQAALRERRQHGVDVDAADGLD